MGMFCLPHKSMYNQPNDLFRAPLIGGAKNEANQTNQEKKTKIFKEEKRKQ